MLLLGCFLLLTRPVDNIFNSEADQCVDSQHARALRLVAEGKVKPALFIDAIMTNRIKDIVQDIILGPPSFRAD